jgi:DNA-binding transcriptional ArsR family regulator
MPSYWLRDEKLLPLPAMKWLGTKKSDQIAALMIYVVLVHNASDKPSAGNPDIGISKLTYTEIAEIVGLSRAKISGGLKILLEMEVIISIGLGRNNVYKIVNYEAHGGWAKLPAKGLYSKDFSKIDAFHKLHLRSKNELNALKLYLIIIALRNDSTNYANVGYGKLSGYTGVHRNEMKSAISLLINLGLIQVDSATSEKNQFATVNMYRLCYLEPYKHKGTTARRMDTFTL